MNIDRPWKEYPIGTKANCVTGGHWTKTKRGWKWNGGNTFPTPGADAVSVTLPDGTYRLEPKDKPKALLLSTCFERDVRYIHADDTRDAVITALKQCPQGEFLSVYIAAVEKVFGD